VLKTGVVALVLASASFARAEPLPDASFKALVDRTIELDLDDGRVVDGRLLAFDAETLTVVASATARSARSCARASSTFASPSHLSACGCGTSRCRYLGA